MNKKILLAVPVLAMALVGCTGESPADTPDVAPDTSATCVGRDKVFVYDGYKAGGIFVLPNHKDCVK